MCLIIFREYLGVYTYTRKATQERRDLRGKPKKHVRQRKGVHQYLYTITRFRSDGGNDSLHSLEFTSAEDHYLHLAWPLTRRTIIRNRCSHTVH